MNRLRPGAALARRRTLATILLLTSATGAGGCAGESARSGVDSGAVILEGLGSHHHAITTSSPEAQRFFDQGLSLAYGFNHEEAKRSFLRGAELDSTCAMCWWGVALVLGPNINAAMDTSVNAEAFGAAGRAEALAPRASEAERAYIAAIRTRYAATAPTNRAALDSAYASAMRGVADAYPDDDDAATLFAQAQMELSPWVYWNADKSPRPGTTELLDALDRAMRRNPNNPGACHLYIHAVEAAYPNRAVACAERLAALMPAAGHVVHMPAHIYLRVGRWEDAIVANEHAVHVDETYIADRGATGFYTIAYYPHNYHFLAFAATMAGTEAKATAAARSAAAKIPADVARDAGDLQLLVAYPQVTFATFERWDSVLAQPMPRSDLRLATGLAWYARGLASLGLARPADARVALDSVTAIAGEATGYPMAPVMQIALHSLRGEAAAREGRFAPAIADLRRAAALEDELTYMEPPYWHRPVRQRLGAVLLKAGHAREAQASFNQDLERFPGNVWSVRGLEQARQAPAAKSTGG
jgi:tetratricopeptide (TPR) repeat protein